MKKYRFSTQKHLFSAVIFDMDGLVIDSEPGYFFAWQQALTRMGYICSDDFYQSLSGLHYQDVIQQIRQFTSKTFDLVYFNQLASQYWHQFISQQKLPVKKGFFDLLNKLKADNIPFCLATNSSKKNTLICLALAQLKGVFSIIITLDDVKVGKPEPDIFLLATKRLNQPPAQCLVLEDSFAGIQAAAKAGCPSIFIPSTSTRAIDPATTELTNYCFSDLSQVIQLLPNKT